MHQASSLSVKDSASTFIIGTAYQFVRATGLRENLLACLRVGDIGQYETGEIVIYVTDSKDLPIREVPVLPGWEQVVLSLIEGREPDEYVFPHLPQGLHLRDVRSQYARDLYRQMREHNERGFTQGQIIHHVMHILGERPARYFVKRYLGIWLPKGKHKAKKPQAHQTNVEKHQ